MINLESMRITVILYHFLGRVIKFVKILQLEFFKIILDVYQKIKVFIICNCIKIKLVYCIFVDHFIVSYLKVILISKKSF